MQFSHSRIETFKSCLYKYKLRYVDKLKTIPDQAADNALYLGTALHKGIETNVQTAIKEYFNNFYVITDSQINEAIKLEYLIPKVKEILKDINIYAQEYKISSKRFIGFADLITKNGDGTVDIFDFKYSNNIQNYLESDQLHIYKYFLEQQGFKVDRLGFIFIPKISIKQKKTEDIYQFRKRLVTELKTSEIQIVPIKYNKNKVAEFFNSIIDTYETANYTKNPTRLCDWCDYQKYCMEGNDFMILPENKRRTINKVSKKTIWIYGAPFCGKTTFANEFPDPLMLNTDGNIKFVDAPYIAIKDKVTVEGRLTNRKFAWDIFKDTITELEKKQNNFKTIVVDLLEDDYEYCRLYMYNKLGIEHESDNSFKAWDMVRMEYLSTIKRLMNMDYENIILISHEDTSKDITKKSGDKITAIKPNIQDKVANKVAGMVDIVARIVADGDDRFMEFKADDVTFGGGRLKVSTDKIPLEYKNLLKVYEEFNSKAKTKVETPKTQSMTTEPTTVVKNTETVSNNGISKAQENHDDIKTDNENTEQETPKRHRRKINETEQTAPKEESKEEQPVRRRRRRKVNAESESDK